ncbi:MAG: rhomboid family intramembrane serine protease [Desulfobacteraceae bacterium]|nr:rhomboid family intramembrane serine protease [Desulfobacteraceae bacterium]MCB9494964.1 rhomboid family intramembrane serine protease [Desulfobacteraceae bacterium]
MKIGYNSPVILTYAFIAALIVIVTEITQTSVVSKYFISPSGSLSNPVSFLKLFTHCLGHSGFSHLMGNLTLMLLTGPLIEEKYGSFKTFEMFAVTAFVIGIINYFVFSSLILGGSGLVFMLILLSSFTNFRSGKIPLTAVLVAVFFLGGEVLDLLKNDNISQFSHITGGFVGFLYGFMRTR